MIDIILTILALIIFNSGLYLFEKNYGMQKSISALFYEFRNDGKKWWFVVWEIVFSLLIIFTFESHALTFAGACIIFSGLSADTRSDQNITDIGIEEIHVTGAISGIICGMIYLITIGMLWWSIGYALLVYIMHEIPVKNHTRHIEWIGFNLITIPLLIQLL